MANAPLKRKKVPFGKIESAGLFTEQLFAESAEQQQKTEPLFKTAGLFGVDTNKTEQG